ncbi:Ankyrin repeat-containing domain protein [Rhypophila decipiens]
MPLQDNPRAEQALVVACRRSTKAVEILLEHGASANVEDESLYDPTPLGNAVLAGQAETARLLIQYGAFVNRRDRRGRTPLLLAAQSGPLTIFQDLLQCRQVDVDLPDDENPTPFLTVVTSGRPDIVDAFLTHGYLHLDQSDLDTALGWAAGLGHLAVVDILIGKWGAQVSQTVLIQAAHFGHVAVVESLFDNWGADISVSQHCRICLRTNDCRYSQRSWVKMVASNGLQPRDNLTDCCRGECGRKLDLRMRYREYFATRDFELAKLYLET